MASRNKRAKKVKRRSAGRAGLPGGWPGGRWASVDSHEDDPNVHTGEVNAERPHLAVPLLVPLDGEVPFEQALELLSGRIRDEARDGKVELVAIAKGVAGVGGTVSPLELVLFRLRESYLVFITLEEQGEEAILLDGEGHRYQGLERLSREEAMRRWITAFVGWNYEVPGLFRLRYAFVSERPGFTDDGPIPSETAGIGGSAREGGA